MDHRDALISEVTVVFDETPNNVYAAILANCQAAGLLLRDVDAPNGVLEGDIESQKLPDLRAVVGVRYIRISMEYIADYPAGDPRDADKG